MQREDPLDALAERHLPYRERGPRAAPVKTDHNALENLDAFLVPLAHLDVHADGVAGLHRRPLGQLRLLEQLNRVHNHTPRQVKTLRRDHLLRCATISRKISCSSSSRFASASRSGRRSSVLVTASRFRQRRISAWLPDSNTSGTDKSAEPCGPGRVNVAGRVYCGKSSSPRLNESSVTDCSSPTTPGTSLATASRMTIAGSSPPVST